MMGRRRRGCPGLFAVSQETDSGCKQGAFAGHWFAFSEQDRTAVRVCRERGGDGGAYHVTREQGAVAF